MSVAQRFVFSVQSSQYPSTLIVKVTSEEKFLKAERRWKEKEREKEQKGKEKVQ